MDKGRCRKEDQPGKVRMGLLYVGLQTAESLLREQHVLASLLYSSASLG